MTDVEMKPAEKSTENESEEKPDPDHQRKLNVGNLPYDVTEQQLREHFKGYEIEKVEIFHYRKNTLALLLFKDKETAAKALGDKDGSFLSERRLRIQPEYITIRNILRETFVIVVDDENATEEQLWDKVKAAGVEPTFLLLYYPLCYICPPKDSNKTVILEKMKEAGFNAHDVQQRDQNQHLGIWRAAQLFFRNRNRVQLLNIPFQWTKNTDEIKKNCAEHGTVIEAVSNNLSPSNYSSNYACIFYQTEEQAIKAANALNGRIFEGKRIHALHLESALIPNYKTSVYVSSLHKTTSEEQVYDHFKQFGEIDFVNRHNCSDAAIVCFKSADSVEKALACTTFPEPTKDDSDAIKDVTVQKYDGPLVLRPWAQKRKFKTNEDGTTVEEEEEMTKEQLDVLKKLKVFHPIFVGNIPFNCPPSELKQYFGQHGKIKFTFSPHILSYRLSAPHPVKTFIVYYTSADSVASACQYLDHRFFGGHRLHVLPLRGEETFTEQKTLKVSKIPYMSEDALFKKIKPFVGKIRRIVKKTRSLAYVELSDPADVEKLLNVDHLDHPFSKGKVERVTETVNIRLYDEDDPRVLSGIAKVVAQNPDILKKTPMNQQQQQGMGGGPMNKRPRLTGLGFGQVPGSFNPNNPDAIQDLLRLAFMSGKNLGEASNSFNDSNPPMGGNNFGQGGGFGNRNNQGGGPGGNFRGGQGRMNQNQNNNFGNNNAGGGNFQNTSGPNRFGGGGGGNQPNQNQNRGGNVANQNQNNQGNRGPQNKPAVGTGLNLNRNTFGGGNNNFGGNNNDNNFSTDNFGGNNNRNNNFGANRNQNNFGGNNRFGGNNQFSGGNFNNNRNQNNSNFDDNDNNGNSGNNFGGGNKGQGGNFNQNRQNKPFNSGNNNQQGGGMNRNFGAGNSNSGGFNSGNPRNTNTGSTGLAGNIFNRRF